MSKSSTTTDADWLHIPHAGELLVSEFLDPLGLDIAALADALAIDPSRVQSLVAGTARIDGELDLRLAKYFGMSEGFFMRFQTASELQTAKRALNGDLDRIVPRAA